MRQERSYRHSFQNPLVTSSSQQSCFIKVKPRWCVPFAFPLLKKMTHDSENVSFCPFWPGFGLSGLVMAFRACVWPFCWCANCQDHEEMKPFLKQMLKEQLQRTRQFANRKKHRKSNSWPRGHREIVQTRKDFLLLLEIERRKRICNSQSKDSFSFLFLSNRCVFDSFCYWFLKRCLVSGSVASNYQLRVSVDPC